MPTSTIVQRIRNHVGDAGSWCILGNEAADEIERLQHECEQSMIEIGNLRADIDSMQSQLSE